MNKCLPENITQDFDNSFKDMFVSEYIKDFNPLMACLRLGVEKDRAASLSDMLMQDYYTLDLLYIKSRTMNEVDITTRAEVLNNIRCIAITSGDEDVRFKAWSKVARLMGMESIHIQSEIVDSDELPELNDELGIQELAEIYANEVLND